MVIKYKFLTGEKIEIEVSNRFGETMLQIDNEIKNSNRRETRRHQSLNELNDKADLITGESIDIGKDILQKFEIDKLYNAMSKLKPSEQELIHKLYLDKQPMMQAEYAKINKTSVGSIKMQVQRVKAKLKKLL
ncbi:MAG: RNA polymerase sigma factor [Acutalibacteraceae bacterium]